ncbi:MAG: YkvA family protein [Anaerolineae bacterium]
MTTNPRSPWAISSALRELGLAWRLLRDRQVPLWTKAVPLVSLAYLLWPLDVLPDPLLGLGQLDDLAVILLGLRMFIGLCPPLIVRKYRDGDAPSGSSSTGGAVVDTTYRVIDEQDHS